MYGISASWGSNWLSIAALVVATVVAFAIKVADQWDRGEGPTIVPASNTMIQSFLATLSG